MLTTNQMCNPEVKKRPSGREPREMVFDIGAVTSHQPLKGVQGLSAYIQHTALPYESPEILLILQPA